MSRNTCRRYVRGLLPLLSAVLMFSVEAAEPALGLYRGHHVYVPGDGDLTNGLFRPTHWTPTGDGSLDLVRIRWSAYDGAVARGTATAINNDCDPSCASGHITRVHIRFTADLPRIPKCVADTYTYTRLRFAPRLSGRPSTVRFRFCSNRFG